MFCCVWLSAAPWTVTHRLLYPRDSPGKYAGVGCHVLLQRIFPNQVDCKNSTNCSSSCVHDLAVWLSRDRVCLFTLLVFLLDLSKRIQQKWCYALSMPTPQKYLQADALVLGTLSICCRNSPRIAHWITRDIWPHYLSQQPVKPQEQSYLTWSSSDTGVNPVKTRRITQLSSAQTES